MFAEPIQEGKIYIWVEKYFGNYENPLHSEFIINGETVDIFTSDTFEPIEKHLKAGWNDIAIKTTAQQPANKRNHLIFRIGPMHRDPNNTDQFLMSPVMWEFRNGTDWEFNNGQFLHPLGPDVKEVELSYHLYWGGFENEAVGFEGGDYILQVEQYFSNRNSPVIMSLSLNGTPFSSFLGSKRQIVITPLLKPGKNEIKIVSQRVKDSFHRNDIEASIAGPAEWYPGKKQYMIKPITSVKAMQGWSKDERTGQLKNPTAPGSDVIERTISFMVKNLEKATDKPVAPVQKNQT